MTGSGLLVVDKPSGPTSHDVVSLVRRLAGTRRVGHAGTLDPMATGVLLVGVGRATRLLGHLAGCDKAYEATIRLGVQTTTDDAQGAVVATAEPEVVDALTPASVAAAAEAFRGEIAQVPAAVSAVKVDGRRAHQRVRAGEHVELPARTVTVHDLHVGAPCRPGPGLLDVPVSLRCSSGTYVRALARDLGGALAVGGHLTSLRRTAVGPVTVQEAHDLDDLSTGGPLPVLPMAVVARRFFPVEEVDEETARQVSHGRPVHRTLPVADAPVALLSADGDLLALYRQRDRLAVPVAVFAPA